MSKEHCFCIGEGAQDKSSRFFGSAQAGRVRQIGAGRSHPLLLPLLQANANTPSLTVAKAPASTPKTKAVTRSPSPDVLHRRGQCTASLTQFSSPCFDH